MKYLLDSDVAADALKGQIYATELLRRLEPDGLALSIISYIELREGILGSSNRVASPWAACSITTFIPVSCLRTRRWGPATSFDTPLNTTITVPMGCGCVATRPVAPRLAARQTRLGGAGPPA